MYILCFDYKIHYIEKIPFLQKLLKLASEARDENVPAKRADFFYWVHGFVKFLIPHQFSDLWSDENSLFPFSIT